MCLHEDAITHCRTDVFNKQILSRTVLHVEANRTLSEDTGTITNKKKTSEQYLSQNIIICYLLLL